MHAASTSIATPRRAPVAWFAAGMLTLVACVSGPAQAKIPPLTGEAKVKADAVAGKQAWTDKVGLYQLCRAMDRVATDYRQRADAAGRPAPPAIDTPPCAEPGPYTPEIAKTPPPLEASGAHSPATMAVSPPSSKATAAETQGTKK
jgi:hypothetical protein